VPLDALISAALSAEVLTTRGPQNMAQRMMVEWLAGCWEVCFSEPATTDKARGRQDDPFLALCQKISGIAHGRLQLKGGSLGSLNLSGVVDDVLKARRSQIT